MKGVWVLVVTCGLFAACLSQQNPTLGSSSQSQTGQDQTAQSQTGQDQTAQSQTGQDQTGQSQTGQDQTGQTQTGQDQTGQDQTAQSQTGMGSCTRDESRAAFRNCMYNFGMRHMGVFHLLQSSAPFCRAEVFSCQAVDIMMRCLNTQPTTVISNTCWVRIPQELTSALSQYGIPCTFDDLDRQCLNRYTPCFQCRRTSGRGVTNNPMRGIMQNVFSYIAMSMLTGGGGMFGGLASALGV